MNNTSLKEIDEICMFYKNKYPILEFDDSKTAKINPEAFKGEEFEENKLIITFFPEALERLKEEDKIEKKYHIKGENPIDVYRYKDCDVLIVLGYIGCPACGSNLDLFQEKGAKKIMFCGGGGVLDRNIRVGELLLVDGAIRDEGFSYHYLPAGRIVEANNAVNDKVASYLDNHNIPYLRGLVWTTDAIFRETQDRINARREEGAKIVEMEQSGCLAVAKVRGFDYAALIYGGDDCASDEWSNRSWNSRNGIRYDLIELCKNIIKEL